MACGAPNPEMFSAASSPRDYDEVLRSSTDPPRLRRLVRKQAPHDLGIAFDGQQQRPSWRVRRASVRLPIAQSRDRQMERLGKFRLRHAETLSQHLDARNPTHLRQLLGGERLRIGIGQRGGHNLFIGHGIEPRPIGVTPWRGFTRLQGYPVVLTAALPLSHSYFTRNIVPDIGSDDKHGLLWRSVLARTGAGLDALAQVARHGRRRWAMKMGNIASSWPYDKGTQIGAIVRVDVPKCPPMLRFEVALGSGF
jgi:hypothetical protein